MPAEKERTFAICNHATGANSGEYTNVRITNHHCLRWDCANTTEEPPVVLHLQAVSCSDERRVTWDEDVIDNENMGKKSSKGISSLKQAFKLVVCCIYHRPRAFGESSSEESSSSSSDDSDYHDDEIPSRRNGDSCNPPNGSEPCVKHSKSKAAKRGKRKPSPNAYERQPGYGKEKTGKGKPEATAP